MINRDEALKLLNGGHEGVAKWNQRREGFDVLPELTGVNLAGTILSRADLCGVNFSKAILRSASLRKANLSNANLFRADLREADLRLANLSNADLRGADLRDANISQANATHAICGRSIFGNVDLSSVNGIETIEHRAPSTIGVDALYKSVGKISDVFLRGCGVPENLIEYLPSLVSGPTAIQFFSCFISYSHSDKSFARRLHDALQDRGIRCWLDEHQMLPGDDIYEQVDRGIRLWDKVLLCASKDSLTSWWVDKEVNSAFQKEQQLMKERGKKVLSLIPLNLDGHIFSPDWQSGKKDEVLSRLVANFEGWETGNATFEATLQLLVKALRIEEDGRQSPPKPKL